MAATRALLRRNWRLLVRRRRALATALELLLPVAALLALGAWRALAPHRDVPNGWSSAALGPPSSAALDGGDGGLLDSVFGALELRARPLSLFARSEAAGEPLFVAHETTMPGLLVSLVQRAIEAAGQAPHRAEINMTRCGADMLLRGRVGGDALAESCAGWVAPHRIALVPDVPFTRNYLLPTLAAWHPPLTLMSTRSGGDGDNATEVVELTIPGIEDVVTFFDDEQALEEYVRSEDYGVNASNTSIHAAIVFHTFPTDTQLFGAIPTPIDYSIRLSAAAGNAVGTSSDDGQDKEQLWDALRDHQVKTQEFKTYAHEGFLTLQSLVARFVNCRPAWNTTTGLLATATENDTSIDSVVCAQSGSVANESVIDSVDDLLLEALGNDVKLSASWQLAFALASGNLSAAGSSNLTGASVTLSNVTKETLLAPMRVLPQPLSGSRVIAMPVSQLDASVFYDRSRQLFPLALTGAYLYPVASMVTSYSGESNARTSSLLHTRGVHNGHVIFSWFVVYGLLLFVSAMLQLLVTSAFNIFWHSNVLPVLCLLTLYAWSLWCYAFAISSCTSSSQAGVYISVLVMALMLFLDQRLLEHLSPSSSALANFLSPLAAARGIRALLASESMQQGISWENIDEPWGGVSLSESLAFLALDCVVYAVLGLYFQRVISKDDGESSSARILERPAAPWYFPILPSFWISCFKTMCFSVGKPRHASDKSENDASGPVTVPGSVVMAAYGIADGVLSVDEGAKVSLDASPESRAIRSPILSTSPLATSLMTSTTRMQSGARFLHLLEEPSLKSGEESELHLPQLEPNSKPRALYLHRVSVGLPTRHSGDKTVLDGVNLRFSTGKISCVLGPGGSGKSTLMSVLSLRLPMSSGAMTLSHGDISWKEYVNSHQNALSFCFQDDALFPDLTVHDHLELSADLVPSYTQGAESNRILDIRRAVDRQLRQFELLHLSDTKAKYLTSGARRSLSLAMALLTCELDDSELSLRSEEEDNHARFVFLDEPTIGMDPCRRQRTWDILRGIAHPTEGGRLSDRRRRLGLVIATSDVEEAEALGDEISVLVGGKASIVGSPEHLKAKVHSGYSLSFAKTPSFQQDRVMQLITSICRAPDAGIIQVTINSATEFDVCIPEPHSSAFPALFQQLETQYITVFGATAYSLSLTTLDDAVGKVVDEISLRMLPHGDPAGQPSRTQDLTIEVESQTASIVRNSGQISTLEATASAIASVASQVGTLSLERLTITFRRQRMRTFASVCGPVVILIVLLAATGAFRSDIYSPSLTLSTQDLPETMAYGSGNDKVIVVPYYCTNQNSSFDTDWCNKAFSSLLWENTIHTSGIGEFLPLTEVGDSGKVQLFGINYTSDEEPELLQLQWELFLAGYAMNLETSATTTIARSAVANQAAAFLVSSSSLSESTFSFDIVVNTSVPHGAGIFKAQMHQAIYRVLTSDESLSFVARNHPLPLSMQEEVREKLASEEVTTNAFLVAMAFSYLPTVIIRRIAARHLSMKSGKHIRLLGGMKVSAFWLANYCVDVLLHFLSATIFILSLLGLRIAAWQTSGLADERNEANPFGALVVLLLLFGFTVCPLAYGLSFAFCWANAAGRSRPSTEKASELVQIYAFILFAVLSYSVYLVTGPLDRAGDSNAAIAFQNLFSFIPQFALGYSLHLLGAERREDVISSNSSETTLTPFSESTSGVSILYLTVTAILYFTIVTMLDSAALSFVDIRAFLSRTTFYSEDKGNGLDASLARRLENTSFQVDSRVHDEERHVTALFHRSQSQPRPPGDSSNDIPETAVLVLGVSKVFQAPRVPHQRTIRQILHDLRQGRLRRGNSSTEEVFAVKNVSFHVKRGECLAILGAPDSGKSTLMQILSGQLLPSRGRVILSGTDAVWNQRRLCEHHCVGYAPARDDFLKDAMSTLDNILVNARLRSPGLKHDMYVALADEIMRKMSLTRVQNRLAGALLPGERRRLCLSLALLRSPDVLLLDEPTLGLEGKARQQVWDVLRELVDEGRCKAMVVATSSLDECQALSNRVGIMTDGALSFIDSYKALERDFEYGWVLDVRIAPPTSSEIDELLRAAFNTSSRVGPSGEQVDWASASADLVVFPGHLASVCERLGRSDWAQRVSMDHSTGCWIARSFSLDQPVAAPEFFRWWVGEQRFEALSTLIEQTFGAEYVRLLRREPEASRFQLLFEDAELKLSQVFKVLEAGKRRQVIDRYEVAPASFASVTDTFARAARSQRLLHHGMPQPSR